MTTMTLIKVVVVATAAALVVALLVGATARASATATTCPPASSCTASGRSRAACTAKRGCAFNAKRRACGLAPTCAPQAQTPPPTPKPTPKPTLSTSDLCAKPPQGCNAAAKSAAACAKFSGCAWIKPGKCVQRAGCDPVACTVSEIVVAAAEPLLPGCVQASPAACDEQRAAVHLALGLAQSCGVPPPASIAKGASPPRSFGQAPQSRAPSTPAPISSTTSPTLTIIVDPIHGSDDDANDGSAPVATITKALAILRSANDSSSNFNANAKAKVIRLASGTHRPPSTIELTQRDSNLVLEGDAGAEISGAIVLSPLQWFRRADGIWFAVVPDDAAARIDLTSALYVNGVPYVRARYPNQRSVLDYAFAEPNGLIASFAYAPTPPQSYEVVKSVALGNSVYNTQRFGVGGACNRFDPPASYFCSANNEAYGSCPYKLFSDVFLTPAGVAATNANGWNDVRASSVMMHVFHPIEWAMWSFRLASPPTSSPTTSSPTTGRPSTAPSTTPSRAPTSSAPSRSPSLAPSRTPSHTPSRSPSHAPSFAPSKKPTQTPSRKPSHAPSTSPSRTPSTSHPSTSPVVATPHPSRSPSRAPQTFVGTNTTTTRRALAPPPSPQRLYLAQGGFQEARGDCGSGGGRFAVENALALLDAPGEFFFDAASKTLYVMPNDTSTLLPTSLLEMSVHRRLVSITSAASNITLRNLRLSKTLATHMDPKHEVPSGGDWTVTRNGAVFVENATNVAIQDCAFANVDGNGVFASGRVVNLRVQRNSFHSVGSTAVLLVGSPRYFASDPWSATLQDRVSSAVVSGNVIWDVGVFVKQASGVFVALAKDVLVENNVIFNGPRAGLTVNDGFGGGHVFWRNVVFNQVLETNDHGPFNAWDRQKWDAVPAWNSLEENLFVGNTDGPKGVDLDDGTQYWRTSRNVVVYGLFKLKGSDVRHENNLVILPPVGYTCVLITPACRFPAKMSWTNNTCITATKPYMWVGPKTEISRLCDPANVATAFNAYMLVGSGTQTFTDCTGSVSSFAQWRARGQDRLTTFSADKAALEPADVVRVVGAYLSWF